MRLSVIAVAGLLACRPDAPPLPAEADGRDRPIIDHEPALVARAPDSIGGFSSEVGSIRRLSDGSVVVADMGARQLVRFDSTGRLLGTLGRGGQGPGEFERLELLQVLPGDTLLVWDQASRRLTWLDPASGGNRNTVIMRDSDAQRFAVRGQLGSGDLLIEEVRPPATARPLARERVRFTLAAIDGQSDRVLVETEGQIFGGFYFFAPGAYGTTSDARVFVGESSSWEIRSFDGRGQPVAVASKPWTPEPIPAGAKDRMRDLYRRRGARPELTADERFLPTVPAFGRLLAAPDGSLWVRSYSLPYEAPDSMTVFGPTGAFLGVVTLPTGMIPTDVGHDYILGFVRDGDEVPAVHLHRVSWAK